MKVLEPQEKQAGEANSLNQMAVSRDIPASAKSSLLKLPPHL